MLKIYSQTLVVAMTLFLLAIVAVAGDSTNSASKFQRDADRLYQIATNQEPIGSTTSWSITTNSDNQIVFHNHNNTSGSNWIVYGGSVPISLPHTFVETNSGISFLVETDGRHITASGLDGKILWRRDPFGDAHLKFYRTKNPQIVYIGKANERGEEYWKKQGKQVIGINFNSSQFGEVDIKTGDFFFGGQD